MTDINKENQASSVEGEAEGIKTEDISSQNDNENVEADARQCDNVDESVKEESKTQEESSKEDKDDEDLNTKYMRLMADFQNFKRRTEKQKSDIYAYANEKITQKLIEVVDNFERALVVEPETEHEKAFKDGMELVLKSLLDAMESIGVAEIEAYDKVFDPNIHSAVMMQDSEEVVSGNVCEVLQKGYTLNGKVVRPSMVKVAN